MDEADALDEDTDLFDSDYDLSAKVDDDDRLFDDFVDDRTTSDTPIDVNIEGKDKGKQVVTNEAETVQVDYQSPESILPPIPSFVNSQSAENEPQNTLPVHNPLSSLLNSPQYTNGPTMYTQLQIGQSATLRVNIRAPPPMLGAQYSVSTQASI
ncbi:hypothetical protein Salat_0244400 [Sesamum alatum]|uniref:Uncharacterized protein n=1 Tax=Sesamum alatum TaxID=300844 RepID=A0AAE1Z0J0_9LAMI|nr:hypothetical protein Salat_0244400 [Sesamum alatum]